MVVSTQSQEVFPYTRYTPAYMCVKKRDRERDKYYKVFCSNVYLTKREYKLELACLLSFADTSLVNMNAKQMKKRDVESLAIL